MLSVELKPGLPGVRRACLRPLCGDDEALIGEGSRRETLALLQRLLVENGDGTLAGKCAPDLPICDVDRLFASLHLRYFGDLVESKAQCSSCAELFEISFSLSELQRSVEDGNGIDDGLLVSGPDEHGAFELADGQRFRLPTMRDLDSVGALDPEAAAQQLRRTCVMKGDPGREPASLDRAMENVGSVLDTDLETTCPICEARQRVRFEMQSYFGQALASEKRYLTHEVHQLARAYGWSRSEILAMTREDRRAHVRLILAEPSAAPRSRPAAIQS